MWTAEVEAAKDIPLGSEIIKKGDIITVTKGIHEVFAIWRDEVWDCPAEYIGITVKIISYG